MGFALHNPASMANHHAEPNEHTHLLAPQIHNRRLSQLQHQSEASSLVDSHVSKEEQALAQSTIGERLNYNEYTTIDWLHDLVKDSYRLRLVRSGKGLRGRLWTWWDASSGWVAVAIMGTLTACVAFVVDVCEATVSDWKFGYCTRNPLMDREACCHDKTPLVGAGILEKSPLAGDCEAWHNWTEDWWRSFAIYGGFAIAFGIISATATTFTKRPMPGAAPGRGDSSYKKDVDVTPTTSGKSLYMAAGAGIAEIKCILSGFEIPHFLDFRVLFVKALGATFAVATGMCLGKEGPFVHISGCVGYLVAKQFPKYRDNGRKMREILSASVAAGLSVAFGAPIGGVLFSYEEISTYFPRKVLWRAFLCSMFAAIVLRALNPTGTGKLVLFETDYGTSYQPQHYVVFVALGVAGGVWGGLFCKLNFLWSKWFRSFSLIKNNPVLEVALVVLVTVLLQYPNPLTREPGDIIISNLLVNCHSKPGSGGANGTAALSWVCQNEAESAGSRWPYVGWLIFGCLVKLGLTIITFGAKVPSGIIIPALDAGALFGRLVGQSIDTISPGIFAMVGAGAFLAGVSRMTISLCVIMFELTGELEYVLPHMIAILVAKWVADAFSAESVYDLTQAVLGHPFLDGDHMLKPVQRQFPPHLVRCLIPPKQTMDEITVRVGRDNKVARGILEAKLERLKERGLLDAGLVLVQGDGDVLQGYLGEAELDFGLTELGKLYPRDGRVRLLGQNVEEREEDAHFRSVAQADLEDAGLPEGDGGRLPGDLDLSSFVDRTPLALTEAAPMEYAVEAFGKLGLRHLMITEEGTGRLVGVCLKKRLLSYLEGLH